MKVRPSVIHLLPFRLLILARICRIGQKKIPRAFIIANVNFKPDYAAIKIKWLRGEEDWSMKDLLSEQEIEEFLRQKQAGDESSPNAPGGKANPICVDDNISAKATSTRPTIEIV